MTQPVIDALRVANALRRTGMEREQADGLAAALGTELGEHVAVKKDLDLGFGGMQAQLDKRFADVDVRFAAVDARFDKVDARFDKVDAQFVKVDARFGMLEAAIDALGTRLDARFDALHGSFKFLLGGFGLLAAMLAMVIGMMGVLHADPSPPPPPQPIVVQLPPWPASTVAEVAELAGPGAAADSATHVAKP